MCMANKLPPTYRAFYRKLLTFYPRPFRERFGESMEQTFDDLCNEQEEPHATKLVSLTIGLSIDTGIGIVKEHVLHLSQRRNMNEILRNPKAAAIIGLLLFLPGALMLSALVLNIEPPLGPLSAYLDPPDKGSHILSSLTVLAFILFLPGTGLVLNIAATEGKPLKAVFSNLTLAVITGALLVLPFVILELTMGQKSYSGFPLPLFGILWLLPAIFTLVAASIARTVRAGESLLTHPAAFLFRIAFLAIIAIFWAGLVNDQMPCFLGVPNCD